MEIGKKESEYLRGCFDCNCNDCIFMQRNFEKLQKHKDSYKGTGLMDNLQFGYCDKLKKDVSFTPNTCQIETQNCFVHRNYKKYPELNKMYDINYIIKE